MNASYFITGAAIALLLASCSATKKTTATPAPPQVIEQTPAEAPRPVEERPRRKAAEKQEPAEAPRPVRPTIRFSQADTEHVRLPSDRYAIGTVTSFDLDRLSKEFYYPYKGKFLSDYGMRGRAMHTGVDIKTVPGDTIRAAFPGVVRMSKPYSSYGNIVVIRHYDGFETLYAHCSDNLVNVNDVVEAGDPVALSGRTGRATTEHLHFEFRVGGNPVNPNVFVDFANERMRSGHVYVQQTAGGTLCAASMEALVEKTVVAAEVKVTEAEEKKTLDARIAAQNPPKPQTTYHTVKQGDTLSALARTYKTTVEKICELNNIKSTSILRLGQKLKVK